MALEDLTPVTRTEAILDGDDISPVTRMEYFLGKAANEVPKPEGVSDAGKVLTVNAAGDGFELDTPDSGLPPYTDSDVGRVLTVGEEDSEIVPVWGEAGSGGLPAYSNADIGKALTVGSETSTGTFIPEQTIVAESQSGVSLTGVTYVPSSLDLGIPATLTITVGETVLEIESSLAYDNGAYYFRFSHGASGSSIDVVYLDDSWKAFPNVQIPGVSSVVIECVMESTVAAITWEAVRAFYSSDTGCTIEAYTSLGELYLDAACTLAAPEYIVRRAVNSGRAVLNVVDLSGASPAITCSMCKMAFAKDYEGDGIVVYFFTGEHDSTRPYPVTVRGFGFYRGTT